MVEREREIIRDERPAPGRGDNTAVIIVGVVLALVALVVIVALIGGGGERDGDAGGDVNVEAPEVDVPEEIDVDVEAGG